MAEDTAQTITRLEKTLEKKEAKLKTSQEVLGVRHKICKAQAQSIKTVKELIEELRAVVVKELVEEITAVKGLIEKPHTGQADLLKPFGEDHA
jgi:hypothetical protein